MSIQVRRRREAAAFLQTYVGAQAELIVDTTNNRVQVHDGTTAGGWPAAGIADLPGRNAAINGTFAINQRAYAGGTALTAGAYAHDRWKAGAGGCTYTFTQTVPDTTVTISAGSLVQAVDAPNVYATTWWLTWTGTATARVWQGSASGAFSAGIKVTVGGVAVNALPITGLTIGTVTALEFASGTLGLVQFEAALPGAGPTRFERRHNEVLLCQRYYETFGSGCCGTFGTSGLAILAFRYSTPKRATPTVGSTTGQIQILVGGSSDCTGTGLSVVVVYFDGMGGRMNLYGAFGSPALGQFAQVDQNGPAFFASAEL